MKRLFGPLRRGVLIYCVALAVAGCAERGIYAPDSDVARFHYPGTQPSTLSLVTNIRNLTNKGAHSALIINASEQVVFNPAGTWRNPAAPEQGDVNFGFSPKMRQVFIDYHARETYRVQIQTVSVAPDVAEAALAAVKANGPVGEARCTVAISHILRGLPGFESFPLAFFPSSAAEAFAKLPGVTTEVYRDDSPDNRSDLPVYQ